MIQRAHKLFTSQESLAQAEVTPNLGERGRGEIFAVSCNKIRRHTSGLNIASELRQSLRDQPWQAFVADQSMLAGKNDTLTLSRRDLWIGWRATPT